MFCKTNYVNYEINTKPSGLIFVNIEISSVCDDSIRLSFIIRHNIIMSL